MAFEPPFRVGTGYDIHVFAPNRKLILGGVEVPCPYGLLGHSDADVISHAIADAILGALGLADIGHWFPNTDPEIEGVSSQTILRRVRAKVTAKNYRIVNVDAAVIAERPKLSPYINEMKLKIAESLQIPFGNVGIKATTNEGIGELGKARGIACHAVALLYMTHDSLGRRTAS